MYYLDKGAVHLKSQASLTCIRHVHFTLYRHEKDSSLLVKLHSVVNCVLPGNDLKHSGLRPGASQ